jgi:hypothetical protein
MWQWQKNQGRKIRAATHVIHGSVLPEATFKCDPPIYAERIRKGLVIDVEKCVIFY